MSEVRRVLLTGAAGDVGSILRRGLRDHVDELVVLDNRRLEPERANERCLDVDVRDASAVLRAVRDVDVVLHLAAIPIESPFGDLLETNIRGTYHVLEACRRNDVRRFVLASSHHVTGFYEQDERIDADAPPRPDSFYGVSKASGEALASLYHDRYGLEVVCVRIGTVIERPTDRRTLSTWLSPEDAVRLFRRCVEAPEVGRLIVYGVSGNQRRWWTDEAGERLGYVAQDDAERHVERVEVTPPDRSVPADRYQGGRFVDWHLPGAATGADGP